MVSSKKAELYLLGVTIIWGLTFPLVRTAVKSMSPADFVFFRFFIAAVILLPLIFKDLKYSSIPIVMYGFLLGILNIGVYLFQSMGLKTISAAQSAFITAMSVALVPFLLMFFRKYSITLSDFFSSGLCLFGLYILTGTSLLTLNRGEVFTLFCAISAAFTILVSQVSSQKIRQFNLVVFYQIIFSAAISMPFKLMSRAEIQWNTQLIFSLLFCALFATIGCFYLQLKYQKYTTAPKAALIYCAEPLFASLFAWIIFDENLTWSIILGGVIIVLGMIFPDLLKLNLIKNIKLKIRRQVFG